MHGRTSNSYLIHQFLADNTNLRHDRYGGSSANRMRFALEVVDAVTDAIGADRTAIRLSPGNPQFSMVERDPAGLYRSLVGELIRRGLPDRSRDQYVRAFDVQSNTCRWVGVAFEYGERHCITP